MNFHPHRASCDLGWALCLPRAAVPRSAGVTGQGMALAVLGPCGTQGQTDLSHSFPEERVSLADPEWSDVHVVAGALKLFFRELPEPLVPYRLFDPFIEAISKCLPAVLSVGVPRLWVLGRGTVSDLCVSPLELPDRQEQVKRVAELVQSLPPANYATLRYLLAHLCR